MAQPYVPPHLRRPHPPTNNFFALEYNTPWREEFKSYIRDKRIDINERYNTLRRYEALLPTLPVRSNYEVQSKKNSLINRKKELLAEAYLNKLRAEAAALAAAAAANPADVAAQEAAARAAAAVAAAEAAEAAAAAGNPAPQEKAGCAIIFSDNKALYTQNADGINGFPKGDIEYRLTDVNDLRTVYRETPINAALRELWEETGFFVGPYPRQWPQVTHDVKRIHTTLHRLQYPEYYHVGGIQYSRGPYGDYILILHVDEPSFERGPSLLPLSPHPQRDAQIARYVIRNQFTEATRGEFNSFSQVAFPTPPMLPNMPGGRRHKKKTRKTKRRARKTMRSRG